MIHLFVKVILFAILCFGCKKGELPETTQESSPGFSPSSPPFTIAPGATYYKNLPYGSFSENVFDIFLPSSTLPTALVIQIHGGGFKSGDKADNYNNSGLQNEVNAFLTENIAFATLNYRLLLDFDEQEGVLKPLYDCKRALQFIRYYHKSFNINKAKIAVKGGSAGAGTCLWLGLQNDMADANASDPVFKESTRVQAIVANNTQASYDLVLWPEDVFAPYQSEGFNFNTMLATATLETFLQFYGIKDTLEVHTPKMVTYRSNVNMLNFITPDDPEIYLASAGIPFVYPVNKGNLIHHPLHAFAVMRKANDVGAKCKATIPEMNIDNTSGETAVNFLIRKLKE